MKKEKNIHAKIYLEGVIWENLSTAIILIGVFMLLQPFQMFLYHSYSFIVILNRYSWFRHNKSFPGLNKNVRNKNRKNQKNI